jgi:hypothetical protein
MVNDTAECGTVTDKMFSEGRNLFVYIIKPDDGGRSIMRDEDELSPVVTETVEYDIQCEVSEGVAIFSIIEIKNNKRTLAARGHGHMLRNDLLGVAQAASFAEKRALTTLNGGSTYIEKE